MSDTVKLLVINGWKKIGQHGRIQYWAHAEHQSDDRGAFTNWAEDLAKKARP